MYDDILQAVIDMAETASGVKIVLGSLPPDESIAMTGQASEDTIFLDIGSNDRLIAVCNGKSAEQRTVVQRLNAIHTALTRRKDFPETDRWQIYAIETISSPRLIGREANRQWLYGSSLAVKVNIKGVC
jgi:hypothetical protein